MDRTMVSPRKFMALTGLSRPTVYRRLKDGSLPAIQIGGPGTKWMIDLSPIMTAFDEASARMSNRAAKSSPSAANNQSPTTGTGTAAPTPNLNSSAQSASRLHNRRRSQWLQRLALATVLDQHEEQKEARTG